MNMDETIKLEVERPSDIYFKAEEDEVSLDKFESGEIDEKLMNQRNDAMGKKSENGDRITPHELYSESPYISYEVCDFDPKNSKDIKKTQYYDKTR